MLRPWARTAGLRCGSHPDPHQDRDGLAGILGLEPERVRVIAPDVGGGFGGKGLSVEDVLLAWVARPSESRCVGPTRSENLISMHQGRAQWIDFELGGTADGKLQALRLKILQDAGAYPGLGAFLANLTAMMASGVYVIPKIEISILAVTTNTTPTGPVRGAGRPEATQMIERAIDMFAAELAIDPAEVRRRNFIPADAFPYTTAVGTPYDSGDYVGALDRALEASGYQQLRQEQDRRRAQGGTHHLGIGLSVYVEITNGIGEGEFGAVEITEDGGAIVKTGSFSHGQGHETTFAQIVAERLGMPAERVTVLKGDTDSVARGSGHLRLQVDPDRRRGRRPGIRDRGRAGQAAGRRRARGQPRGHGARPRRRALPRHRARRRPR